MAVGFVTLVAIDTNGGSMAAAIWLGAPTASFAPTLLSTGTDTTWFDDATWLVGTTWPTLPLAPADVAVRADRVDEPVSLRAPAVLAIAVFLEHEREREDILSLYLLCFFSTLFDSGQYLFD